MDTVKLLLNIEPKPLKRARHSKRGSFISTYYDKATYEEMDRLKWAIANALSDEDKRIILEHTSNAYKSLKIALKLEFGFMIPSSYSKKRYRELINQPHTNHVDLDNLIKNILDRGIGTLWEDDKYIHSITASKRWSDNNFISIEIQYESTQ